MEACMLIRFLSVAMTSLETNQARETMIEILIENKNVRHALKGSKTINYTITKHTLMKRVILITGTPCVGKTTTAKALATKLNAEYINLTDFAKTNNLTIGEDKERNTIIINEEAMQEKLGETIDISQNSTIVIDGHYASAVTPTSHVALVFVLRRNPKELKQFMEKRGYSGSKMWENLQAEILDVCLGEAVEIHAGRVCELDVTGKPVEEVVGWILDVFEKRKVCLVGTVDWLGTLEQEGILDEYLKA
jgi:adenylate kinase